MKILIVKLSSIGDVIHTLPVLPAIQNALPDAEISWVVEKGSAEVLRDNPQISRLIEVDTKSLRRNTKLKNILPEIRRQLRSLRGETFDVALDFQGLFKSAAIAKLSKATRRYGFSKESLREPASRFLLTDTFEVPESVNIVRKNLALAHKALQIPVPENNFEYPIYTKPRHTTEAEEIIEQTGANYAILNPAAGWVTKLWHAEKFGRLADKLWTEFGLISVVTTAPNEKELAAKVLEASKSGKIIAATPSLKGFYELAKRTKVYIGNDTGPTFLAIAAKAPVVSIFGPTEWWRNGSPDADDIGIERDDIPCRVNCHRRACSNWICMDIPVDKVLEAVGRRMQIAADKEVQIG